MVLLHFIWVGGAARSRQPSLVQGGFYGLRRDRLPMLGDREAREMPYISGCNDDFLLKLLGDRDGLGGKDNISI